MTGREPEVEPLRDLESRGRSLAESCSDAGATRDRAELARTGLIQGART